jgi:hypothetical protein
MLRPRHTLQTRIPKGPGARKKTTNRGAKWAATFGFKEKPQHAATPQEVIGYVQAMPNTTNENVVGSGCEEESHDEASDDPPHLSPAEKPKDAATPQEAIGDV